MTCDEERQGRGSSDGVRVGSILVREGEGGSEIEVAEQREQAESVVFVGEGRRGAAEARVFMGEGGERDRRGGT